MSPVIVLCGGKGERLRSVLTDRPKVLAEVGGVSFLSYILERLVRDGASEILLSTGYRAEMVAEYVASRGDWGANVRCVAEERPLGTAGAIRHVATSASIDEPFFVLNGDTWFDGSLDELAAFHDVHEACLSIAVVAVEDSARYGSVRFDEESGELLDFEEKGEQAVAGWINAGLYRIEPEILERIPAGRGCSLEREIFPDLIGRGLCALGFDHASFLDIGTPEDLPRAEEILREYR